MKSRELHRQHQVLLSLFKKTDESCGADLELRAHWARYLCIVAAGLLENGIVEVFSGFVRERSSPEVAAFALSRLEQISNPKASKFIEVARSFNRDWEDQLAAFCDEHLRGDAIDSIMANRHLIAHGQQSGITLVRLKGYLDRAVEVLEYIEGLCS